MARNNKLKILICTGIYPPEIGGPAEYAKNLKDVWENQGNEVSVKVFSNWDFFPSGVRHIVYFFSTIGDIFKTDFILALDTFSAGFPAVVVSKIFRKKIILRTGGDFLWEMYVERTGDLVLLRDFYKARMDKLSKKERFVFKITKFILRNVDGIVWSTSWQKDIFMAPYALQNQKNFIIENYYGSKLPGNEPSQKNFIAFTRKLKWKHIDALKKIFEREEIQSLGVRLESDSMPKLQFMETLKNSYAIIITSLGDISPNTILDAIRMNKPFILTKENGLYERIKDIGIFVDPENDKEIADKVIWLTDPENYEMQKKKIESFTFTHTWEEMAKEYLDVYNFLKS